MFRFFKRISDPRLLRNPLGFKLANCCFGTVNPQLLALSRPLRLETSALPICAQKPFEDMKSAIKDNDFERLLSNYHSTKLVIASESDSTSKAQTTLLCNNLLLEGLIQMSKLEEARRSFFMILEQGFQPNLTTFEILMDGLLNHWKEREALEIQNIMTSDFKIKPRVGIYNLWITYYLKNHQLTKALQTFEEIKQSGLKANEMSYRAFMKYYLSVSDYPAAGSLKEMMAADNVEPTLQFYNSILRVLSKKLAFAEMESVLQEMREKAIAPQQSTYKILLESYASVKNYDKLKQTFEEMERNHIQPDINTYNCLLAIYSNEESSDKSRNLLLKMNSRGVKFNAFTYFSLLFGLIKQHKFLEASEMISKMDSSGTSLPSSTYAIVIDLCCKKRFLPGIHFIRSQMRVNNVKPNLVMFTSMIEMNLRSHRYGSVEGLLREMEAEGMSWNLVLYGVMLNHFIELFDIQRVKIVLERMKRDDVELNNTIYDTILRAFYIYCRYVQGGYLFRVLPVLEESSNNLVGVHLDSSRLDLIQLKSNFEGIFGLPFKLSIHIFNDLMLTFLRLARFEEFFHCYNEISKNTLKPNQLTYTLLIKARLYLGQPEAARGLLSEMLKFGIRPTVLQCALIFHVLCRNQDTTTAETFLSEIINMYHLKPNHVFYASLLYAYSRKRDFPSVFYTFDRLEKAGFTPDTETCNYVLSSLFEVGEYSEASRFFEKMIAQGIRRNTYTYSIMTDRLVLQGDADRFLDKLADCLSVGNSIDAMPFNKLFNNYYRAGQVDVMRRVMDKMIECVVKFDEASIPFVMYIFTDHLNVSNLQAAEDVLKKAIVDFDPSNFNVKTMIDRYREHLQMEGIHGRLEAFDKFLDFVDDLKRLWVLPSPNLPSDKIFQEIIYPLDRTASPESFLNNLFSPREQVTL